MYVCLLQPLNNEVSDDTWIVAIVHPELHSKEGPIKEMAVNLKYLVRPKTTLAEGGAPPQLVTTYQWTHWNRSGFIEFWSNNKVTWRHSGEAFTSPQHGSWEKLQETIHVTFHHRGQDRLAVQHNFRRVAPGVDIWVRHKPASAASWCILVPAVWPE